MKTRDFIESLSDVLKESVVDRNTGIIRQCCLMNAESRNGRIYTPKALSSIKSLAEKSKSFLDHGDGIASPSVMKLLGTFENVRERNGALFGDLHILKESVGRELVLDLAENMPHLAGFSIAAKGTFSNHLDEKGREIVEDVVDLRSIDFVGTPATTSGVFEQEERNGELRERIKELEEKLKEKTRLVSFLYNELEQKKRKPEIPDEKGKALIVTAIKGRRYGTLV